MRCLQGIHPLSSHVTFVVGQNIFQVKIISTEFDSQFPLSFSPNYSLHFYLQHIYAVHVDIKNFLRPCKP